MSCAVFISHSGISVLAFWLIDHLRPFPSDARPRAHPALECFASVGFSPQVTRCVPAESIKALDTIPLCTQVADWQRCEQLAAFGLLIESSL